MSDLSYIEGLQRAATICQQRASLHEWTGDHAAAAMERACAVDIWHEIEVVEEPAEEDAE